MFVIHPEAIPVLRVATDKEHYFPVRRILALEANGAARLMSPFSILNVGLKEIPAFLLNDDKAPVKPCLAVLFARPVKNASAGKVREAIYGWAAALVPEAMDAAARLETPMAFSAVRPKSMAPDMATSDMWLYVNNHEAAKGEMKTLASGLGLYEMLARLTQTTAIHAGDVVLVSAVEASETVKTGDAVRAGVTGVGMLTVAVNAQK